MTSPFERKGPKGPKGRCFTPFGPFGPFEGGTAPWRGELKD